MLTNIKNYSTGFVLFFVPPPPVALRPNAGHGLLILGSFSITCNDASQSVGLPWMSDQPKAETSTSQHTTLNTDIHVPGGIRTHNPSKQAVVDPHFKPRGH